WMPPGKAPLASAKLLMPVWNWPVWAKTCVSWLDSSRFKALQRPGTSPDALTPSLPRPATADNASSGSAAPRAILAPSPQPTPDQLPAPAGDIQLQYQR